MAGVSVAGVQRARDGRADTLNSREDLRSGIDLKAGHQVTRPTGIPHRASWIMRY